MLTVLQVIPELETGGAERTVIDVAAALVAGGGRALVASRGGRLAGELADAGGELRPMSAHAKDPLRMTANAIRLAALAARENVDVIHARSRAPAWSAFLAARASGRAFVTTYHGTYNARRRLKRFYNSVMARGDAVIANSQFIADRITAEHGVAGERISVIPRGLDMAALDPGAVSAERVNAVRAAWGLARDDRRAVVLMPGRLTRWKGQGVAIEALALLDEAHNGRAVLVLPGDDQGRTRYRAELEDLAAARGVGEAVIIPGHCADMPAAYALADIVVSASVEPEAFGRVAAEGQAMGRPVIAADHGGARETVVVGEGGVLVAPGEASALSAALSDILAVSPAERLAMGERGARRVRRVFSVDAMQAATLAVYEDVLEGRRHG